MPPQDPTPAPLDPSKGPGDTQSGDSKPEEKKKDIDLGFILLPKKEAPGTTPQSAQRINAGALLEQEEHAAEVGLPKPEAAPQPLAAAAPKPDDSVVRPIETYQADIERLVQDKNVSVVSIAAAEAQRRAAGQAEAPAPRQPIGPLLKRAAMIAAGVLMLAGAAGIVAYFFVPHTVPLQTTAQQAPFISVDGAQAVVMRPNETREQFMQSLNSARQNVSLSLGLIEQLIPAVASTTPTGPLNVPMDAQAFLSAIAPHIPTDLLRNVEPTFLLGTHVYDSNLAFLILKVDSYESAYSGMLAWEPDMPQDLAPLFSYTPRPHIPEEGIATSSASSTPTFLQTGFVDHIVDNHDARVLQNSSGDIYLLWTFLDRNTLVITPNEATLREIISRLTAPPTTGLPAQ